MKAFVLSVILCWIVYMPVMSNGKVQVGADRLEEWLADLDGCRVALAVNQTSLLSASSVHLVDTLLARVINVVALFAPEHGLRGTKYCRIVEMRVPDCRSIRCMV